MDCNLTSTKRRRAGLALSETLIALGIGVMLLSSLAVVYVYYLRAFAGLENYMNLNNESRYALDPMTREIRQADDVLSSTSNKFSIRVGTTTNTYFYDAFAKTLNRTSAGTTKQILAGCDYWRHAIYDRNLNEITNTIATNLYYAKAIQVTWICTRSVVGRKINSEDVQSQKIVIRKQKPL
jgi:hypothetical protein